MYGFEYVPYDSVCYDYGVDEEDWYSYEDYDINEYTYEKENENV